MMKFLLFFIFSSMILCSQETPTTDTEIPYPWAKFAEQEDLEKKLQDFRLELSYHKTPLENVVDEWRQIFGISMELGSGIFIERADAAMRLTMTTAEMPFLKALDLVTLTLDLVYYLDGDTLVLDLPGTKPPKDPQEKYWRGLQKMREEVTEASESFIPTQQSLKNAWQERLSHVTTLPPGRYSLAQIVMHLQEKDAISLVPTPELWSNEPAYSWKEPIRFAALLDMLVAEKEADLFFTEEALYLLPKKGE